MSLNELYEPTFVKLDKQVSTATILTLWKQITDSLRARAFKTGHIASVPFLEPSDQFGNMNTNR
jgi:hypothetical protein